MPRETISLRTVAPNVAEQDASTLPAIGMKLLSVADGIMRQNAEARIVESMSKAQLDLNDLTNRFQIENQSNPVMKTKEFEQQRQAIFDGYAQNIPASFRMDWEAKARDITAKNDLTNQTWALKQAQVNTKESIGASMKNNFRQAYIDGMNYANSDGTVIDAMANFATAKNSLAEFGTRHLGEVATSALMESYDTDSLKSFLGGMLQENPVKALQFLDSDEVKGKIDPDDHRVLLKAAEGRALQLDKIRTTQSIVDAIKAPNSLLAEARTRQLSVIEIESAARQHGLSEDARNYLLKSAGYEIPEPVQTETAAPDTSKQDSADVVAKPEKPQALRTGDKATLKLQVYDALMGFSKKEDLKVKDIQDFQNVVLAAANAGAMTQGETEQMLTALVTPLADRKAEEAAKFQTGKYNPFVKNAGFEDVEKYYNESVRIPLPLKANGEEKANAGIELLNTKNRLALYEAYIQAVGEEAQKAGVGVTELDRLNTTQRVNLLDNAQVKARQWFASGIDNRLSGLKDLPNQVLANGKIIPTAPGMRKIKPDFGVNTNFKVMRDKNGIEARVFDNGNVEVLP